MSVNNKNITIASSQVMSLKGPEPKDIHLAIIDENIHIWEAGTSFFFFFFAIFAIFA